MPAPSPDRFLTRRTAPDTRRTPAVVVAALAALTAVLAPLAPASAATPRVHAIVGARIVTSPGQVIPHGNIIVRDGIIVAVGPNAPIPADARVWNADSLTVYPGLIDAFVMPAEAPASGGPTGRGPATAAVTPPPPRGAVHELASVTPEWRMVENLPLGKEQLESLRGAGFTTVQAAPRKGIVRGQSAVIELGDGGPNRNVLRADAAQVFALQPAPRQEYPNSLMGVVAVMRQVLMDGRWYRDVWQAYRKSPAGRERPAENLAFEALEPVVERRQPVLFVADEMLEVLRAGAIAREATVNAMIVGEGDEYKRVKEITAAGFPLVVPVDFPEAPDVSNPDNLPELPIEELRHWDQAPGNPAALQAAGATFALTTNGLKDARSFRAGVARAIARGLRTDRALAAVTTVPASMLGLADRIGTIAPGKIANLTVTRGDLFSDQGKVREVWIDGNRYETAKDETQASGKWILSWGHAEHHVPLTVSTDRETTATLVVGPDTLKGRSVSIDGKRLRFTVQRGNEAPEIFELDASHDVLEGTLRVENVGSHDVVGVRSAEAEKAKDNPTPIATPIVMGNSEAWRMPEPPQPAVMVVKNATIWTEGAQGTLENADLLVKAGKIAAVGKNLAVPSGALVVDAAGKQVSPGVIDCHNHWAILGNVNECTNSVTAEVRVRDVINSESIDIYRELAGGVTMVHLLHGSCNAIGGQCAVIKMRWGASPDRLFYENAAPTIKFALGENPKQANFGSDRNGRYPQTRGGVEQVIRDAFTRARDYQQSLAEWKAGKRALPPRRDLQLECLAEILAGQRFVHSHSYRQDEIQMLMRVAEEYGFRVGTFQHVLEGYKVADEMAAHGAGGSTFSDWWAYKQEVIDAIPWNGFLMWDRGVVVSYNSDSNELARRLNTEAAKAIKYGGVPPVEALKFVTVNPAKQMKVEKWVGSLEPGKDADFAIWSGSPLSPYSACEQTWVDGRKYFDRAADLAGRGALQKEREALIARARDSKKDAAPLLAAGRKWPPRYLMETDMTGNDCGTDGQEEAATGVSGALRREVER